MTSLPHTINWTVAEYCQAFHRYEILVDKRYQRSGRVWPRRAQSHLIETILRGFPIPKLTLHQKTDLKSKKTINYVVDGQQRTNAIVDFFDNRLQLSRTLDLEAVRGKTYERMDEDLQNAFLSYPLQFDQFTAVDEDTVREYFRRINSFTAPLNPEERRNADFQGHMKWFILSLTERHSDTLAFLDTLTERQLVRMADHKLFAEVVHALLNGVTTTSATSLRQMYGAFDKTDLPGKEDIRQVIDSAFDRVVSWTGLQDSQLVTKGYMFYSLLLAIIAVDARWDSLDSSLSDPRPPGIREDVEYNLLVMDDALVEGGSTPTLRQFVSACDEKTNTKAQRETRIRLIADALGAPAG